MVDKPVEIWRVLLVDDDEDDYLIAHDMLSQAQGRKIELDWAPTYQAGQQLLQSDQYHAVLVDYDLGLRTGIELIRETVDRGITAPLILYTGRGGYEVDVEAMQAGATLYLTKTEATPLLLERSLRYAIDHKRIEKELDHRLQERSDILESIQDGFFSIDRNWRITYINQRAAQNGGFEPEALIGHNIWEAFPQMLGTLFEENYRFVMNERTPVQFEMRGVYKSLWYNISVYPSAEGISIYWQDITERKQAEETLRQSEELYRAIARNLPDGGVFVVDQDLRYLVVEGIVMEHIGLKRESMEGHTIYEVLDRQTLELVEERLRRMLAGEMLSFETLYHGRTLLTQYVPLRSEAGQVTAGMVLMLDVTERKKGEASLQAYTEQLKRSNQALEDFAFIASHDLREPLRKVQAFGSARKSQYSRALDEQGQNYIERMQQAASRMESMLDGLLDYSRVTTQSQPYAKVDLYQVATEVLSDLEVRRMQTGGRVELEKLPVIEADPVQIRQLLQNLLGNALKFQRPGVPQQVRVSCRPISKDAIELVVEDNGIGFDMRKIDYLFQPFHRLNEKSTYDGTGMGLAICQKIAERHGGSITAWSEPGKGSTFVVTLACKRAE